MNMHRERDPKDELMRKFSKNFRKLMENRENLSERQSKTVKFNAEILETSFGGTQTPSRIKGDFSGDSIILTTGLKDSAIEGKPKPVNRHANCGGSGDVYNGPFSTPTKKPDVSVKLKERLSIFEKGSVNSPVKTPVKNFCNGLEGQIFGTPECFNTVTFETPKVMGKHRRSGSVDMETGIETDSSSVTVAVRVRPFTQRELTEENAHCVVSMVDNETTVTTDGGTVHPFSYDYSFWSFDARGGQFATQQFVYENLAQPMLSHALEGYNVCLFAYGQTGSGKSYSIMGHGEDVGIVPRFCEEMFCRVEDLSKDEQVTPNVEISFYEIYNEKIHDLLGPSTKNKTTGKKATLKVREHPLLGPFVEGLSSYVVKSFDDVKGWLSVGNKHRATASTGMNDKSSRSHSVFTILLTQTRNDHIEGEDHQHSITSKINLVDLAGSERQSQAKTTGDRLRRWEGASINKSLHTLGKVISLLSERSMSGTKKKKLFIPYRDSVLTWMLKESLGGNSRTTMLANISPSSVHVEESLSTLRYAKQARSIINTARVNEDPNARLIRELRMEIENLRNQTGVSSEDMIEASLVEIASLRDQLKKKKVPTATLR